MITSRPRPGKRCRESVKAGGQGRQQAGDTADGHQQANVNPPAATLGEKDPQKRAEARARRQ